MLVLSTSRVLETAGIVQTKSQRGYGQRVEVADDAEKPRTQVFQQSGSKAAENFNTTAGVYQGEQ
jgi:hypothetical protein